jgi:hypothetical protein
MQLPLTDGRAVRMIVALLAAADPLYRLERGGKAESYVPLATAVLMALRSGADANRLIMVVREHAAAAPEPGVVPLDLVAGFAQAALDWWANAASRWDASVAI